MVRIRNTYRVFILLSFMLPGLHAVTQDVIFSQFYFNPLYLNPAFAGSRSVPRLALQYRNQWPSQGNAYKTTFASIDFPVPKLQGGMGFSIVNDMQAEGSYQSLGINAIYATFIRIDREFHMHGAIQATIGHQSLHLSKLVFPDQVDPVYGKHGISSELVYLADPRFTYIDFSSGVLFYSQKFFGGLVARHLGEPAQSFNTGQEGSGKLYRKYTVHLGARLPVFLYGHHRKKFDLSPQFIMQYQQHLGQLNYGMLAYFKGLTAGTWFRQNLGLRYDAVILMVGFARERWQISYSHDIVVSGLWGDTGGTGEISLVFLLKPITRKQIIPF
ncbi:MAG: PorP/SprF family type IX secretion system membrane protein [Mariniphaga sp.]|nr:PorP/SprF family type IX secretion system membrane protein [Mariniphaga sp.]